MFSSSARMLMYWIKLARNDFQAHTEKRIQQITGIYMVLDIIGHILNVGLSVFLPAQYQVNILLFTATVLGQAYNLLLFTVYCLHGTNGIGIIIKDYGIGGSWQQGFITIIRIIAFIFWMLGLSYLLAGYIGLGFGVPSIV